MRNFRELKIWQLAIDLAKKIYLLTKEFPATERYGLSSQLQRAAVSIPSNIAEGASRRSEKDFARFLEIALGSAYEVETQLIIAQEVGYFSDVDITITLADLVILQKQINKFVNVLQGKG